MEKTDSKVTYFLIRHDLMYCKKPNISKVILLYQTRMRNFYRKLEW